MTRCRFVRISAGGETFGIDTSKIREVLGERDLQRVPMSPGFIAGVVPYRGEVLTTVNLRGLLGMEAAVWGSRCVLVWTMTRLRSGSVWWWTRWAVWSR